MDERWPRERSDPSRYAIPALALVVGSGLIPNVWPISAMLMVAVTFLLGIDHSRRVVFLLTVPALAVLGSFALIHQPTAWQGSLFVALVLMTLASQLNSWFREMGQAAESAREVMRRQAQTDELTGLSNRSHYVSELRAQLVEGAPLTIMIMDLNRFKTVNDTLGHGFGDHVLVEVADRLLAVVGDDDIVARLGGDEFAVISRTSTDEAAALRLAGRIADAVSRRMVLGGMSISTTISCGVALSPEHGDDVQTLMRHADMAMYDAKQRGFTVQIWSCDIEQTPPEELTLSASLKEALAGDQFVLHYQPKVDLRTGRISGFEALARWQHPTLGLLSPDRFIHLVTLSDECQAFADRIIEVGVRFAIACRAQGHEMPIAVNLSARSLFDDTLPDRTAHLLREHDLDPSLLTIEITEADIMDEAGLSSRVLARLASLGVRVSIDDFGTGYSSLARLVDLPISEVKIDRHFVAQAVEGSRDEIIVRSIVDLGETLGLEIVAEGVETDGGVHLLRGAGCHQAQGYLFSPPIPQHEALELLNVRFVVDDDLPDLDGDTMAPSTEATESAS